MRRSLSCQLPSSCSFKFSILFSFQLGRSWSCPAGHISLKMAVSACFLPCCVGQAPTGSMTIHQGQLAAGQKLHCVGHHNAQSRAEVWLCGDCHHVEFFLPLCGLFAMPLNAWLWPPFWLFYSLVDTPELDKSSCFMILKWLTMYRAWIKVSPNDRTSCEVCFLTPFLWLGAEELRWEKADHGWRWPELSPWLVWISRSFSNLEQLKGV